MRDRQGLTYGAFALIGNDRFAAGDWSVQATYSPTLASAGILAVHQELLSWIRDGVTEDELREAKSRMIASAEYDRARLSSLGAELLREVESGQPPTDGRDFRRRLSALTVAEVNAAIRQHLDVQKMTLVVTGGAQPETLETASALVR